MNEVYQQIGEEGLNALVCAFYKRVKEDDLLSPMYPSDDWEGAQGRLADFLVYRCGGSQKYIEERGHSPFEDASYPVSYRHCRTRSVVEAYG